MLKDCHFGHVLDKPRTSETSLIWTSDMWAPPSIVQLSKELFSLQELFCQLCKSLELGVVIGVASDML